MARILVCRFGKILEESCVLVVLKYNNRLALLTLLLLAAAFGSLAGGGCILARSMNASASACAGETYPDVCPGDWFYPYVMDLSGSGAVSGFADGTFRPYSEISRGQIIKVIVQAMGLTSPAPFEPTFADVPATHTFFQWIETGAAKGLFGGYPCGGVGEPCDSQHRAYFRSGSNVSRGQLARMIVGAKGWSSLAPSKATFSDVPVGSPFFGYVERVAANGIIGGYACGAAGEPCPGTYFRASGTATRSQASKMVSLARQPAPIVTGTPAATATTVVNDPCPIFPADNIWNKNIAALPTHSMSAKYIASIGLGANMHADFGSGLWQGEPIGIPFVHVPAGQPLVPIHFTAYGSESDPGPYPVPVDAPIEGGPNSSGDRHVLVVDQGRCKLYETYYSFPNSDGSWNAKSGAVWSLNSNALRTDTWTSGDAAGLPIYPGLVKYDEVASGVVRHAIRFTAPQTQKTYIWPARHYASNDPNPALPPMGLRVRLKTNVNLSGYPQQVRVILQALKDYGMVLADNGSPWSISGAPDPRWDNQMLHAMDNLHGSDFEAVDESGLMVDPNSGQSR